MNQDRHQRNLERLEQKRRQLNQRLDTNRARLNARFDEKQAQLSGKLNVRQEQIIAAALELLSADGLANLSLREIAKRLNLQAPALYWYFKNKEVLVDFMAEAILQKQFHDLQPRAHDEPWQDWLTVHMLKLREAMLAYPDGARVVAGAHLYPAVTLAASLDTSLESLMTAGIDLATAHSIIVTATTYTFGYVIEEQSAPTPEQLKRVGVDTFMGQYPNIVKTITEIPHTPESAGDDYLTGLSYIINGGSPAPKKTPGA